MMKYFIVLCLALLLAAGAAMAQRGNIGGMLIGGRATPSTPNPNGPVMVQHESSSNTRYMAFISPWCYHYQMANATHAGNAVILGVTFGANLTPSASDDAGNTYAVGKNFYDAGDNQSIAILGAFNVAAGARQVNVCFPSNPGSNVAPMATEYANVTGFDGAGVANNGSGLTAMPGTLTPTQTGDLIEQVTFSIGCPNFQQCQASYAAQSKPNLPTSLLSADLLDGFAAQYGVYTATAAVSPTMGMGTSRGWVSAAVALKSGPAGSVPTGLRIVHMVHETLFNQTAFSNPSTPYPNPTNLQFPSSGNLLITQIIGGDGTCCNVNSVTDTANPSWLQTTEIQGTCCSAQTFYVPNATTANNLAVTMNWTSSAGSPHMMLYDVAGAATSPFDTSNGATGDYTPAVAGSYTIATGYTITPSQANELIVSIANWDVDTGTALDGQNFLGNSFDGDTSVLNAPELVDEQGGLGAIITANTSPVGFTWELTPDIVGPASPPGNWASLSAGFKGASSSPPPTPTATIAANPTTISSGSSSTLTWSSTNASSCTGTGFSTGGAIAGSVSTGALTTTTMYSVTCSGSSPATVTVTVTGGGGTTQCDIGPPYTGSVPAAAIQAGFTRCAANYDFTYTGQWTDNLGGQTHQWSNMSTWFNCNESYGPQYLLYRGTAYFGANVACDNAHYSITTDSGAQVFAISYYLADGNANLNGSLVSQAQSGAPVYNLAEEYYIEYVMRLSNNNNCSSYCVTNSISTFTHVSGNPCFIATDMEWGSGNPSTGTGESWWNTGCPNGGNWNGTCGSGNCATPVDGPINTAVTTWGNLTTGDGVSTAASCTYSQAGAISGLQAGAFYSCFSNQLIPTYFTSTAVFSAGQPMFFYVSDGPGTTTTASVVTTNIQRLTIWECPGYTTGPCITNPAITTHP